MGGQVTGKTIHLSTPGPPLDRPSPRLKIRSARRLKIQSARTNSSNPAAERAIVSKESYGKQLGRISDALDSLIRQSNVKRDDAIDAFLDIKARIDDIKHSTEATRFEAVLVDLRKLRRKNKDLFDECLRRVAELDAD